MKATSTIFAPSCKVREMQCWTTERCRTSNFVNMLDIRVDRLHIASVLQHMDYSFHFRFWRWSLERRTGQAPAQWNLKRLKKCLKRINKIIPILIAQKIGLKSFRDLPSPSINLSVPKNLHGIQGIYPSVLLKVEIIKWMIWNTLVPRGTTYSVVQITPIVVSVQYIIKYGRWNIEIIIWSGHTTNE